MVDFLGAAQGGLQLGAGLRSKVDAKKANRLAAQKQEVMGGLRRQSLGLGGATVEQQEVAQKRLLADDPAAFKIFKSQFDNLSTLDQDKLKADNAKFGLAAVQLSQLTDEELPQGAAQTAKILNDNGDTVAAQRALELAKLAQTDPEAARLQLGAIETQSRDIEKAIASREKLALAQAKEGADALKTKLSGSKDKFTQITTLRKDVEAVSKEFTKVRDANNRVQSIFTSNEDAAQIAGSFASKAKANAANNPDELNMIDVSKSTEAFGDMALIFNFMKMLDPGSTVREGEFATAQNTGGADEKIVNFYNNALHGTRLTAEQRQGMLNQATGLFKAAQNQNKTDTKKFRNTALEFGLPMNQIFEEEQLGGMSDEDIEAAIQAAQAAQGGV